MEFYDENIIFFHFLQVTLVPHSVYRHRQARSAFPQEGPVAVGSEPEPSFSIPAAITERSGLLSSAR